MCGRFVDPNLRGTEVELSQTRIAPFPRRYNVKPTQTVLILLGEAHEPALARWWLIPSWFKGADPKDWKATTFNARIEDAAEKPTFRGAWKHGRCLIPMGGYYEWTGEKGAKQPHFIRSAGNEETLWAAGLTSRWQDMLTCTMMTRAANDTVNDVHTRMPVMLNADERDAWLHGSDNLDLGVDIKLKHWPVRRFGIQYDGEDLIEPIDA